MREAGSIAGIDDWREIAPDRHNDWIGQRSDAFQKLYPMGSKSVKAGREENAIFKLFSNGYKTSRDAYLYNSSRAACAANARRVVGDYLADALRDLREGRPDTSIDDLVRRHSSNVRWDQALKDNLGRRKTVTFSLDNIWKTQYRPFVKQHCYVDYVLVNRKYQMDSIFPAADSDNRAICVPGTGSTKPSALMVDAMPDVQLMFNGQCFPRYRYQQPADGQGQLPGIQASLERIDNITDTALRQFRIHYRDSTITKDAIFDYVYGVLHAPDYRERFANDLTKELPRIPFAPFHAFTKAGRELAALHLGYEHCDEYPLELVFAQPGEPRPEHFRLGTRAMRFDDDEKTELMVNDHLRLRNIPAAAHRYHVNGRTPLDWFIDRYRIRQDKESGIVNDPNGWFDDPRDLIAAIRRVVHVSVESARIIESLPDPTSD